MPNGLPPKGIAIPLERAEAIAMRVFDFLGDYCERIEIAGSIRRRAKLVHDIDIVLIPVLTRSEPTTLFGDTIEVSQLEEAIVQLVAQGKVAVSKRGPKYQRLQFGDSPIPVDLYFASRVTWSTLLLIRTGSKEHNIYLCSRAKNMGMQLKADGSGLLRNGLLIEFESEEAIFQALGLAFVSPERRQAGAMTAG